VRELGIPQAEVARLLGVTTSAIAKALKRAGSKQVYSVSSVPFNTRVMEEVISYEW